MHLHAAVAAVACPTAAASVLEYVEASLPCVGDSDAAAACSVAHMFATRAAFVNDIDLGLRRRIRRVLQRLCATCSGRMVPDCLAHFQALDLTVAIGSQSKDSDQLEKHGDARMLQSV
jgi:hypothetical protein